MDPDDLVGTEVIAVKKRHDHFVILFDNGYQVEVVAPSNGSIDDAIEETN